MAPGNESYNRRAALVLGCLQILVVLVCVCLQPPMYVYDLVVAIGSFGIWAGLILLITGVGTFVFWRYYQNGMVSDGPRFQEVGTRTNDSDSTTATGTESNNRRAALVLGCLQILVALVCISRQPPMNVHDLVVASGAVGSWVGLFFLITGILTVLSWHYYHSAMIVGVMTMTIIASTVAAAGITASAILLLNPLEEDEYKLQEELGITMLVMCVVEGTLHIVTSAFCCAAVCCGQTQEKQRMFATTSAGPVTMTPAQDPDQTPLVTE